jgi:ribosomal protein S8
MSMVSRPTKRVWLDVHGLGELCRGRDHGYVRGLRGVGESLFVSTDRGVMEARECVERKVGGMVLCRVL